MPATINVPALTFPVGETIFGPANVSGGGDWSGAAFSIDGQNFAGSTTVILQTSYDNGATWWKCCLVEFREPRPESGLLRFHLGFGRQLNGAARVRLRVIATESWSTAGGSISIT